MVELSVRLVLAGLMVFIAGVTGVPPFMAILQLAGLQCAMGVFTFTLDRKNLRLPAISGLIACADALMIEFALASVVKSPALITFGFLAFAPIVLSAARFNANPFLMAPVASAGLVVAHMANNGWHFASTNILGVAATFLIVGCLVKPISKSAPADIYEIDETPSEPTYDLAQLQLIEIHNAELRSNYRQLKDAYRDLDRKSRKDRVAAILAEANGVANQSGFFFLCEKIAEATGAAGVLLYTVANASDQFVIKGAAGELNESQLTESLHINAKQSLALVCEQADMLSLTLEPEKPSANVVLQHEGKVIGILTITGRDKDQLFEAQESIQTCTALVASLLVEAQRRDGMMRRLTEVEVLYAVVSNAEGACTKTEIAARIARDFQEVLQIEHLSISAVEEEESRVLALEGRELNLLGSMKFDNGGGLIGWLNSGSQEILISDARSCSLLPSEAIVRNRIGSYVIIPIACENGPIGYITAASGRVAGIDSTEIATLRSAAAELSRLFARPDDHESIDNGLLSPRKFVEAVGKAEGVMVTLIPLQYKEYERKFGKPAIAHAMRTLGLRIRPHVPVGSLMCKHPDGLIMVYLLGGEKESAVAWANELVAKGIGADLKTPDGSAKMPLQLRAKVASLSPQFNQFLVPAPA
jgi:GAF domain-containing protein